MSVRTWRDKIYKYRLETKLTLAAASEIIANLIAEYRVEVELTVNRRIGKRTVDIAANEILIIAHGAA